MASITCPSCGTGLKINAELPPGMLIKCPRCEATFAAAGEGQPGAVPAGAVQGGPPMPPVVPPPFRHSRAVDPDETEDEPIRFKRRKRKARKGGSGVLILCLGIGAAVLFVAGGVTVLISLFAGGSLYSQHEGVARDALRILQDLASTLESVKDVPSARTAAVKLNQLSDRMEELGKQERALPKLSVEEQKRLKDQYEPQLLALQERLRTAGFQAGQHCGGEPSFMAALRRMQDVGAQLQRMR